jgi:hypothetical protein
MNHFTPALAIVRRELLSALRRRRPFLNLLFVLLPLMVLFCALMFLENSALGATGGAAFMRVFFGFYVGFLYLAGLLTAVTMGALGIQGERETDTLDLLRMTYISPAAILTAKLASATGLCLLTMVAVLPLLGIQFFFTGVGTTQSLLASAIVLSTTATAAMVALACSVKARQTLGALAMAFGSVILMNGGLLVGIVLFMQFMDSIFNGNVPLPEELAYVVFAVCPPVVLSMLVSGGYESGALLSTLLFQGLGFLVAWSVAIRALRNYDAVSPPPGEAAKLKHAPRKQPLRVPIRWKYSYPLPLPDGANPMYHKDLLESTLTFRRYARRIFFVVFGLCMACSFLVYFSRGDLEAFVNIASGLYLLLIPAFIATAMAREHAQGNVDALRTTLLKPRDILRGKLFAAMRNVAIPFFAMALGALPLYLLNLAEPGIFAVGLTTAGTIVVCSLYVLALSLLASCTSRKMLTGLIRAYTVSTLALIVFPYILGISVVIYGENSRLSDEWGQVLLCTSPYFSHLMNIDWNGRKLFNPQSIFNVVTFTLISAGIIALAIRRFEKDLGKQYLPEEAGP